MRIFHAYTVICTTPILKTSLIVSVCLLWLILKTTGPILIVFYYRVAVYIRSNFSYFSSQEKSYKLLPAPGLKHEALNILEDNIKAKRLKLRRSEALLLVVNKKKPCNKTIV